jgi:hypothetical protein
MDIASARCEDAFLHGYLQEEVYMEVPPRMAATKNGGNVCKLKKGSLWPETIP